jgi:hypothetical protein
LDDSIHFLYICTASRFSTLQNGVFQHDVSGAGQKLVSERIRFLGGTLVVITEDEDARGYACDSCLGEPYLAVICEREVQYACKYCGKTASVAIVPAFNAAAARVSEVLEPSPEDTARPFAHVVADNLPRSSPAFVNDLVTFVQKRNAYSGTDRFDWQFSHDDREEAEAEWNHFRDTLKGGSRFFNEPARQFLNELFEPLDRLFSGGLFPSIKPVRELAAGITIFRARRANTAPDLERIKTNPVRELHAPPPEKSVAGRMNVERLPAFYGSLNIETAIAETRPAIGVEVAVGEFRIARPLRVLDFTMLARTKGATFSIWDPHFRRKTILRAVLRRLHERIRLPIRPSEEHEYLTTQVLADYLVTERKLDGVLFGSAQVDSGVNVVIFHAVLGKYTTEGYAASPLTYRAGHSTVHRVLAMEIKAPQVGLF